MLEDIIYERLTRDILIRQEEYHKIVISYIIDKQKNILKFEEDPEYLQDNIKHDPETFRTCHTLYGEIPKLNNNIKYLNNFDTNIYDEKIQKYMIYYDFVIGIYTEDLLLQSLTHSDINKLDFNIEAIDIIDFMIKLINLTSFHIFKIIYDLCKIFHKYYNFQIQLPGLYHNFLDAVEIEKILDRDYFMLLKYLNIQDKKIDEIIDSIYFMKDYSKTNGKIMMIILEDDKYNNFLRNYYPIVRLTILINKSIKNFINKHYGKFHNIKYTINLTNYFRYEYDFQKKVYKLKE